MGFWHGLGRALGGALILIFALMRAELTHAEFTSYHIAHPLGWRHELPVGESPGWSESSWFNLEINEANVWGTPLKMTDKRNGNVYGYQADFEQTSVIANFGWAVTPKIAFGFEVPYANRGGGFLDDFIDQFHSFIQSDRFERNYNSKYGNKFSMTKNGVEQLSTQKAEGVGNFKMMLKYWFLQVKAKNPGVCDCGVSISGQVKFPTQTASHGLSSGTYDYTGMVNFGYPIFDSVGLWFSAALTRVGEDETLKGWPLRHWDQMYEATMNIGLYKALSAVLQVRYESPLMEAEHLEFKYQYHTPTGRAMERVDSGWNSLVYWRGSECVGLKLQWGKGSFADFLFVEDWGKGKYDSSGATTYINNAPDVEFISQLHFLF
jgi:hypothetical protein